MLKLKLGTKGEIVIPKKIREYLGLFRDKSVTIEIKGKSVVINPMSGDVVKECEEMAKEYNLDHKKLVYGDKLYEKIFSCSSYTQKIAKLCNIGLL